MSVVANAGPGAEQLVGTVVIVDDDAPMRNLLATILRQGPLSYDVVGTAATAEEGAALTEARQPDVVLLDVVLGLQNGRELVQTFRLAAPGTMVVGLSAHPPEQLGPAMMAAGAQQFYAKSDEMLARLPELLARDLADFRARGADETRELSVLIVDDDAAIRRLARRLLTDDGGFVVVGEAGNGVQAIDLARRHQPDVVLLDLLIPELDGWGALPTLVRDAPRSMVLVLSVLQALDEADATFAVGAFAYLEKSMLREGFAAEVLALRRRFERALAGESVWAPGRAQARVRR